MDATPSNPGRRGAGDDRLAGPARTPFGRGSASSLGLKWSALHDAAAAVGSIAGLTSEPMGAEVRNFPAVMRSASGWRRELAEQGIEDLTAIMEPGVSALMTAHARGANPAPAARALWREFTMARDALLTLVPPPKR